MLHELRATAETVHWGFFNHALPPALLATSGDLISVETITQHAGDAPDLMMDEGIEALFASVPVADRSPGKHIMTGPIAVAGAMPGDMLEVQYLKFTPRLPYGSNVAARWGYLFAELGEQERVTIYQFDSQLDYAKALFSYDYPGSYTVPGRVVKEEEVVREPALKGFRIPVRPHVGCAGVAPAEAGRISTVPPSLHGGNIDNWRIGAGSTMYYPVFVPGAGFSLGDPHLTQGDGELSGTAIEASMEILIRVRVRKDFHFPSPLLETASHWMVHGFDPDLNQAMRNAAVGMLQFLTEVRGLKATDAYTLMSAAVDFSITQVVDGRQGVHASIPKSVFPMAAVSPDLLENG